MNWKKLITFSLLLLALTGCTIYVRRSPEEIAKMDNNIKPLNDSIVILPDSGHSYILSFVIHKYPIGFTYRIRADRSVYCVLGGSDLIQFITVDSCVPRENIEKLINDLNNIGFFSITKSDIINKMYKKQRSCLGLFLGEPKIWPPIRWLPPTWSTYQGYRQYTIMIVLKNLNFNLHFPSNEDNLEKLSSIPELKVIKQGIDLIETFIKEQGIELNQILKDE